MNLSSLKTSKEIPKLFSVVLDQIFMSVTTLLTTIVLARTYDKINYADLVLLFSITLFILGFQSSIISKPYAISINDYMGKREGEYFQFNLNLKLFFTFVIIIIFPILYYFSFDQGNAKRFLLFLLYIIAHSSYFFVRETLLSQRKTKQNLGYGVFCSIAIISALLIILFYELQDFSIFLLFASLIYLSATFVYLLRNYRKSQIVKRKYCVYWSTNWKVGKWLLGSNFLFHISSNIYPWLLLYITSKDDIAVFGVLMSVAGLVNPILTALSSYLLPIFVNMNKNFDLIRNNVRKWNFIFALMALLLISLGYFLGQTIIDFLFGTKYNSLGILVLYPFIVQAVNIFFQPFKIAMNAIKRTDVNFLVLIPRSIITLVLGYFLVVRFGVLGVFYTMIVENLFYQIFYYVVYLKVINSKSIQISQ